MDLTSLEHLFIKGTRKEVLRLSHPPSQPQCDPEATSAHIANVTVLFRMPINLQISILMNECDEWCLGRPIAFLQMARLSPLRQLRLLQQQTHSTAAPGQRSPLDTGSLVGFHRETRDFFVYSRDIYLYIYGFESKRFGMWQFHILLQGDSKALFEGTLLWTNVSMPRYAFLMMRPTSGPQRSNKNPNDTRNSHQETLPGPGFALICSDKVRSWFLHQEIYTW